MPTTDELHAADQQHAAAIAAIESRLTGHDTMLARHEAHLSKMDETIAVIRENMGRVATKDDISDLRRDITQNYSQQLAAAQSSIPAKFAAAFGGIVALIAVLSFAVQHFK